MAGIPRVTGADIGVVRPTSRVTGVLTVPKNTVGKLKELPHDVFKHNKFSGKNKNQIDEVVVKQVKEVKHDPGHKKPQNHDKDLVTGKTIHRENPKANRGEEKPITNKTHEERFGHNKTIPLDTQKWDLPPGLK